MADCEAYLVCCASVVRQECDGRESTRDDVALTYALAIRTHQANVEKVDWGAINRMIIERWSVSGLDYIKKRAWRMLKERFPEGVD